MPYPIALQMYTVRSLTPNPDAFRQVVTDIADLGYDGIEAGPPSDKSPSAFRAFVDDLGLKVTSVWGQPSLDKVAETVELAGVLGTNLAVCSLGPDSFDSAEAIARTAETLQPCAEAFARQGVELTYHNHFWEFDLKSEGAPAWDRLFALAPALKCEIDVYWASNFGEIDVPALVARYAKQTPLMHVKDGPLVKGEPNTACGYGKMNLPAAIDAADPSRLRWMIVELDNYVGGDENMMDAVRDSISYLRTL